MQELSLRVAAVAYFDGIGEFLIGGGVTGTFKDVADDFALQCAGEDGSLVSESAAAVAVSGKRGEFPIRVIERGHGFGCVGHDEFSPDGAPVLVSQIVGIWSEADRFGEAGEFLIVKSGGGT